MSLYNMIFGVNPAAGRLLHSLNLAPASIERLRDVSFGSLGEEVVVHVLCRTGGGNREYYPNEVLTTHPAYICDHDDEYDSTYAHYYLRLPEDVRQEVEAAGYRLEQAINKNLPVKEKG